MKRSPLPDLLKGLAAFFMVQVHITELFIDQAGRQSLLGQASLFFGGPFAAVVFMVVMGYFVAKNKNPLTKNVLRGVKLFALGFLLNIGLNFHLLIKIFYSGWQHDPLQYLFGIDILYLAGLSIIILSFLKLSGEKQKWIALALLLVVSSLTGFLNQKLTVSDHFYILPFIAGHFSWSYFPLFPWLVYPLAGFVFAKFENDIRSFPEKQKQVSILLTAVTAILVIVFSMPGFQTTINLPAYYHHKFWYIFWALGLTWIWVLLNRYLLNEFPNTDVGDYLCRVGRNITAFYVIQWLIIGNLATWFYQTQKIATFPIWTGIIFTVTVVLTFGYENLRKRFSQKTF